MDFDDLARRYRRLFGAEPGASGNVGRVERALGVKLPEDFARIAAFYGGGMLGGKSHHAIDSEGPANNIVHETLRLRRTVGLPRHIVALAEPAESLIVMETQRDPGDSVRVIWCDASDAKRLVDVSSLRSPTIWPDYGTFFAQLLKEEEEEREERS